MHVSGAWQRDEGMGHAQRRDRYPYCIYSRASEELYHRIQEDREGQLLFHNDFMNKGSQRSLPTLVERYLHTKSQVATFVVEKRALTTTPPVSTQASSGPWAIGAWSCRRTTTWQVAPWCDAAVREVKRQVRVLKSPTDSRLNHRSTEDNPLLTWLPGLSGRQVRRGFGVRKIQAQTSARVRRSVLHEAGRWSGGAISTSSLAQAGFCHYRRLGAVMALASDGVVRGAPFRHPTEEGQSRLHR